MTTQLTHFQNNVKMWQKVNFFKNLCDGQQNVLLEMKERCHRSFVKMLFFDDLLENQYLSDITHLNHY